MNDKPSQLHMRARELTSRPRAPRRRPLSDRAHPSYDVSLATLHHARIIVLVTTTLHAYG
jgi:hypothetical protein